MSLSDYLKLMRAVKGGVTPWEIAEATGIPSKEVHLLEVKHRRMGEDDAMLDKLAGYFEVPVEELTRRRDQFRKRLTSFAVDRQRSQERVTFVLETGESFSGHIAWFAREAIALRPDGGSDDAPIILQRAMIADWR